MDKRETYHHGDLKLALLEAGAKVLAETGIEKFSLRQVARKVGVSPSAPAHHFGDTNGLLMAIAAQGFRSLLATMETHYEKGGDDPRKSLIGSGIGYLEFATASPAVFALMFGPSFDQNLTEELAQAGEAAFEHLAGNVEMLTGKTREANPEVMEDILLMWSTVHGFSNLVNSSTLKSYKSLSDQEKRQFYINLLTRTLPA